MEDLDENTTLLILKYLDPKDLVALQLSCKWGHAVASQNSLWKTLCIERYAIWNTHLLPASKDGREAGRDGMQFTYIDVLTCHLYAALELVDSIY